MRLGLLASILAMAAMLAVPASMRAQRTQPDGAPKAPPDLSGMWAPDVIPGTATIGGDAASARDFAAGRVPRFGLSREEPPMQPWAADLYKARRAGMGPFERGKEADDPVMYPYCMPQGLPRVYTVGLPFEIIQTPKVVYMLFESNHQMRHIYMDGRKHLEGWSATFLGNSTGHWEGETLVVETANLLSLGGKAWLDFFGHPFSDAMRITERMRRPDRDTLQIDFLFDDPKAYTKPWTGQKIFHYRPDWDMTEQITCQDHQMNEFQEDTAHGQPRGRP